MDWRQIGLTVENIKKIEDKDNIINIKWCETENEDLTDANGIICKVMRLEALIACWNCMEQDRDKKCYRKNEHQNGETDCSYNVLFAREQQNDFMSDDWNWIRDRAYQTSLFYDNRIDGRNYYDNLMSCKVADAFCLIPHNSLEELLWMIEVDRKLDFSIFKYIEKKRSEKNKTDSYFHAKYGGYLKSLCEKCWENCREDKTMECDKLMKTESCDKHGRAKRMLFHIQCKSPRTLQEILPIPIRHLKKQSSDSDVRGLCNKLIFCPNKTGCPFYHSFFERDLMTKLETNVDWEVAIQDLYPREEMGKSEARSKATAEDRNQVEMRQDLNASDRCPLLLRAYCSICWFSEPQQKTVLDDTFFKRCSLPMHDTKNNVVVYGVSLEPGKQEALCHIRPLPQKYIQQNANNVSKLCTYSFKGKCKKGDSCEFPHSKEEKSVWKWLLNQTDRNLVSHALKTISSENAEPLPGRIAAELTENVIISPWKPGKSTSVCKACKTNCFGRLRRLFCEFCNKQCNDPKQLTDHINTFDHLLRIKTDEELVWKFRDVWSEDRMQLCSAGESCCNSDMCMDAHSEEEMKEWEERCRYREQKTNRAIKMNLYIYDYIDALREKHLQSGYHNITETLAVTCKEELTPRLKKGEPCSWNFTVKVQSSDKPNSLKVALLRQKDRMYFDLSTDMAEQQKCQMLNSDQIVVTNGTANFRVNFRPGGFGSFVQSVIVELESSQFIVQYLSADVYECSDGPESSSIPALLVGKKQSGQMSGNWFLATRGKEVTSESDTSLYNTAEVLAVLDVIKSLQSTFDDSTENRKIVVLTSYSEQAERIHQKINANEFNNVVVQQPQDQGILNLDDCIAVIISTVKSSSEKRNSETSCDNFLNEIALTKSILDGGNRGLFVVGDPVALSCKWNCARLWRYFLQKCSLRESLIPAHFKFDLIPFCADEISHIDYEPNVKLSCDDIIRQLAGSNFENNFISPRIAFDEHLAVISTDKSGEDILEWEARINKSLLEKLTDGTKYAHCRLQIHERDNIEALDIRHEDKSYKIEKRKDCRSAFDEDQILLELTGDDVKVLGVVEPFIDDEERILMCKADTHEDKFGTVLPENFSQPRLYALMKAEHVEEAKKTQKLVAYKIENNIVEFDKFVDILGTNPPMLTVKFLKWRIGSNYPVGLIIGTKSTTQQVQGKLQLSTKQVPKCFGIQTRFRRNELNEADRIYRHYRNIDWLETRFLLSREDLTHLDCFTVDSEKSRDLDDALSIEEIEDEVRIGVHIADVSFFIEKDSCLDVEAYSRGSTVFPLNEKDPKINMLPEHLSEDLCSLLPGQRRPVLSIFFCWNKAEDKILDPPEGPIRAVIRSGKKLSYKDLKFKISQFETLCTIAKFLKFKSRDSFRPLSSREIVETFMHHTNLHVARLLSQRFPDCMPHVCTSLIFMPRNSEKKTKKTRFFDKSPRGSQSQPQSLIRIIAIHWKEIQSAANRGNVKEMRKLIMKYQALVAQTSEDKNIKEEKRLGKQYKCSLHGLDINQLHTTFTSPIRRYFDLIVHRYVVSGLIENCQDPPYDPSRLQEMCDHLSLIELRHGYYDHERHSFALAVSLKNRSCTAFPTVEWCNESAFGLRFPSFDDRPPEIQKVGFNVLGVCATPNVQRTNSAITVSLKWKIRSLDYWHSPSLENCDTELVEIPKVEWNSIATNESGIKTTCNEKFSTYSTANHETDELDYFSLITRQIKVGNIVQVQLTSEMIQGKLQSSIQQFCLTPHLQTCIEHQADALRCFAVTETAPASKSKYDSVEDYQDAWLPVVRMDAADAAVAQPSGATIRGIRIKWSQNGQQDIRGTFNVEKKFCRENDIFNINNFALPVEVKKQEDSDDSTLNMNIQEQWKDFFCVRYNGSCREELQRLVQLQNLETQDEEESSVSDDSMTSVSWVGHCIGLKTTTSGETVTISLRLHQSSNDFPSQLLRNGESFACTVEWLPNSTPAIRREEAICNCDRSSPFIQDIMLGREITTDELDGEANFDTLFDDSDLRGSPKPNASQEKAIKTALRQKFSLIQGPPGTGKTTTGVRLAYYLAQLNRREDNGGKVMYCGPTNTAVDLVACMLQKLKTECPAILRIYGEEIEKEEFPVRWAPKPPRRMSRRKTQISDPTSSLRHIALHHRIRQDLNPYSAEIKSYDEKFKRCNYRKDVSDEDIKRYQQAVLRATWHEIDKAEILLCTCSTAGSPKLAIERNAYLQVASDSSNTEEMKPWQIIIDECSMCTEPETLIPLVAHSKKITKVVLIGDHKQLQPVVLCRAAEKANLSKSLFERYARKIEVMLEEQYRMHEAICEFPSKKFYDGKLRKADEIPEKKKNSVGNQDIDKIWLSGKDFPLVFCDLKGRELTQYVATEEFSEMSKSNPDEARLAVDIAEIFVNKFEIPAEKVVILSYYRAQEREIAMKLSKRNCPVENYTVVLSQGNEWDYVILSCVRSAKDEIINEREKRSSHVFIGWLRSVMGFVSNYNQMNVAITRAKKGLVIIGNKNLLECDDKWKDLIEHYETKNSVIAGEEFLRRLKKK